MSPAELVSKLPSCLCQFQPQANGCWTWQGSVNKKGYGQTTGGTAHRQIYIRLNGPVPRGYVVHHKCGNPACVNPEHLETLSYADHNRERAGVQLTRDMVLEIRRLIRDTNLSARRIAVRLGAKPAAVESVVRNRSWKDVQL